MGARKYTEIPIYIVEDHCDVLPHIYRNIASRHLPFEDNFLVHFDSHPDLLIDKNLPESSVWEKKELYDSLSIENWILPGCYSGQFSKIFWIKPPWSNQIANGRHQILIGKHNENIRLGTPLYYFLSDGIFVDRAKLSNLRQFELFVATWPNNDEITDGLQFTHPYILDVDLDFFSTQNPFLELFEKGDLYNQLDELFSLKYDLLQDLDYREYIAIADSRCLHLQRLEHIFQKLAETDGSLEDCLKDLPKKLQEEIHHVVHLVDTHYDRASFDWSILHNAGMTKDQYALPHHVSSPMELDDEFQHFEIFLKKLPGPPTIITIARSSDDDYCPKHQVERIQSSVLTILEDVFGKTQVNKEYNMETISSS